MARTKKQLVVMRGPSGSGKSTYTKKHFPEAVVCSADHYFERGGSYKFDRTKLGAAHGYSKGKCESEMKKGTPLIVVDNTNTQLREMKHYVSLARKFGYHVRFVRMETPVEVAAARNTHGVPQGRETVVSGTE